MPDTAHIRFLRLDGNPAVMSRETGLATVPPRVPASALDVEVEHSGDCYLHVIPPGKQIQFREHPPEVLASAPCAHSIRRGSPLLEHGAGPPRRRRHSAKSRCASRQWRSTTSMCGAGAAWRLPSASSRLSSAPKPRARSRRSAQRFRPCPGQLVSIYGARTCGLCRACREGRDNLCEHVSGVHGFHLDGFAQEKINLPARLLVPAPPGVTEIGAAVAPVTFGTVEYMLFDNAKLEPGETILVHAGGSGIGSAAIQLARKIGCTVTRLSVRTRRSTRRRRLAPTMSSTTARIVSKASCAS